MNGVKMHDVNDTKNKKEVYKQRTLSVLRV